MKTACLFAAFALASAVAPPKISVSLEGQVITGLKSNVGKECAAGSSNAKNCPYPVASAYDHHDKEVKVQQEVWYLKNGAEPVLKCDTEKNMPCRADLVDYEEPGEYLFLYNAVDAHGNKAVSATNKGGMEGHKGKFDASVTFNLILEDLNKPSICYNQLYSKADLTKNGALFCQNGGFKSDDDKIFTLQGGADQSQFQLKNSLVHDDITFPTAMPITYSVFACPKGTTDAQAIETKYISKKCTKIAAAKGGSPAPQSVPAIVQTSINQYVSGNKRDVGYVSVKMDAQDTAGIYGTSNMNNRAKPLVVAVKVIDTRAPEISIEGSRKIAYECGAKQVVNYEDMGATYVEQLDRCETANCKTRGAAALTNQCVAGKTAYCHFTDTFAQGKCAPQYSGKCTQGRVEGNYHVTYSATDHDSNTQTRTRQITVKDTTNPVLTLLGSKTGGSVYATRYLTKSTNTDDSIESVDGGFTVTDACDEHIGPAQVTKSWGKIPFNRKMVGAYIRTYTATDAAGNSDTQKRTFWVVDQEQPVVTMAGADQIIEATRASEYMDHGATCEDFVDGVLNHRVKVSGDIVDLTVVGTYKVNYDCEDLSGRKAERVTRTVVVQDTTAPEIRANGRTQQTVEAGFPYVDEGATATDTLDGEILGCDVESKTIVAGDLTTQKATPILKSKTCLRTVGDSVNEYFEYNSRESCAEIYSASQQGAKSGKYTITAGSKNLKKVNVLCNMDHSLKQKTFLVVHGINADHAKRYAHCSALGMKPVYGFDAQDKEFFASSTIQLAAFDPKYKETQVGFMCTTKDESAPQTLTQKDCSEDDAAHRCTRSGTYYIKYTTKDLVGLDAKPVTRKVHVIDSLPPVISLHFKATMGIDEQNDMDREAVVNAPRKEYVIQKSKGGISSADDHEENPASSPNSNPHLHNTVEYPKLNLMAETTSSANAWIIGAAASAVAGVALLAASSKKTVTSVPV